jgi:hypothetical protein
MGAYKRLILTSAVLWAISTLIAAYIVALADTRVAELEHALHELDSVKGERRVVLVGSSNVLLGLSASQLKELSGLPGQNVAAYAARPSFREYFRKVMQRIRPNDVVIVSPPMGVIMEAGTQPFGCDDPMALPCLAHHWTAVPRLLSSLNPRNPGLVWPEGRNAEGDVIFAQGKGRAATAKSMPLPRFSEDAAAIVTEQVEMIRARGACPVIALSPQLVVEGERTRWDREFARAIDALKAAGVHDTVVGTMLVTTDPQRFMNDEGHPSMLGREEWTRMVFNDLQETGRCGVDWGRHRRG